MIKIWLTALLIFTIPSNLFLKLGEAVGYADGLLIDYLIPKLYLSDLLILGLLSVWLIPNIKDRINSLRSKLQANWIKIILALFLVSATRLMTVAKPWAGIDLGLHLIILVLLTVFFFNHQKLWSKNIIHWSLLVTLIFQSSLSLYQFIQQRSLLGYIFLGEVDFNRYFILNRGIVFGSEKILPYGTTAHPNVLAGTIVALSLAIISLIKHKKTSNKLSKIFWILSPLFLTVLFLTQSITAWLSLIVGLVLMQTRLIQKLSNRLKLLIFLVGLMISPLLILIAVNYWPQNDSIQRRFDLIQASWQMFITHPFFGAGLNQFTAVLEKFAVSREVVRFVQPVHHLGLLILAELGLVGVSLLSGLSYLVSQTKVWSVLLTVGLILLPIISFDHYLLTLQTGRLLVLVLIFTLLQKDQGLELESE